MLKNLTETNLIENNFAEEYSGFISFDKVNKVLELKNLTLKSTDQSGQLLSRVISQLSLNVEVETIILQSVEFEAGNLNLDISNKLIVKACSVTGTQRFGRYPNEIEIIECNTPEFNFELDARSLIISGSTVGTITINSYKEGGPRVKTINVQGKSTIEQIKGLHFLLENESSTVVIFSQDSKVLTDAEAGYRIMRLISNKFGDVVQSHIFHTNSVELYAAHADKETKTLLFFEKWTNNYGRSIFRPIIWMVGINTAFMFFLLSFSDILCIKNFPDLFVSIFNISPLSSLVPEDLSKTSWEFSLDSMRRVFLAILTYQIAVAARRFSFVKK